MCKKILIVDDDENTSMIIGREIMKYFNVDYDTAYDVFEALRMINTFQYSIIITDISLPVKSGHEIIRICIERNLPIMVVTAYNPNLIFIDKRVNACLTKPIDFDQLHQSIKGILKVQDLKELEYV